MSSSDIKKLECDYLVIGSGATGMAFVDELVHNNRNIKVILVDKRAKPGGHWVDAYPFVRLHQPAAWYGVNSRTLGSGGQDLATKAQILAYYELVMEDLKSTGRLTYFPQCDYLGECKFKSLIDDNLEYEVN
jgi:cation diffusion facilitator CzcD-associated flavoprotein CzcO